MESRTGRRRVGVALRDFLATESSGGAALLLAAAAALVWANLTPHSYESFWSTEVHWDAGGIELPHELRDWVTEGLMSIFFFVMGMEIKREIVIGELQGVRRASLPIAAAAGGMLVPAAIYLVINASSDTLSGWGIPMATDIAFAVGLLTLLGDRVSHQMKVMLLAIAIADDIGAVIVIAFFYSGGVRLLYLVAAVALASLLRPIAAVDRVTLRRLLVGVASVATWLFIVPSGVHASMAGVLVAAALPLHADGRHRSEEWEQIWHRASSFLVLPLFALASAGVVLGSSLETLGSALSVGIIAGLVVGKPLGIWLAATIALRLRIAEAPSGIGPRHFLALGAVAGVGFTVSLFIADLAFSDPAQAETARLAVLVASLGASVLGVVTHFLVVPRR